MSENHVPKDIDLLDLAEKFLAGREKHRSRIMTKSELMLIVDHDTLFFDSIHRVMKIANLVPKYVKDTFKVDEMFSHWNLLNYLINTVEMLPFTDSCMDIIFERKYIREIVERFLTPNSKEFIEPYGRKHYDEEEYSEVFLTSLGISTLTTALGKEISTVRGVDIKKKILRSHNNKFIYPGFENNTLTVQDINPKTIVDIIRKEQATMVVVSSFAVASYIMENCEKLTIIIPNYRFNYVKPDVTKFPGVDLPLEIPLYHRLEQHIKEHCLPKAIDVLVYNVLDLKDELIALG